MARIGFNFNPIVFRLANDTIEEGDFLVIFGGRPQSSTKRHSVLLLDCLLEPIEIFTRANTGEVIAINDTPNVAGRME